MRGETRRKELLDIANDHLQSTRFNRNSAKHSFVVAAAFAGGVAVSSEALVAGDFLLGVPGIIVSGAISIMSFKDGLEEIDSALRSEGIAAIAKYQADQLEIKA